MCLVVTQGCTILDSSHGSLCNITNVCCQLQGNACAHTYNTHYKVAEMQKTCRDASKDQNKVMWDQAFLLDEENPLRLGCFVGGIWEGGPVRGMMACTLAHRRRCHAYVHPTPPLLLIVVCVFVRVFCYCCDGAQWLELPSHPNITSKSSMIVL